jgi:hypothetical protein
MEELLEAVFSMVSVPRLYKEPIWRVLARPSSRCNKHSAYTEKATPPLVEEEATLLKTYMSKREQKS